MVIIEISCDTPNCLLLLFHCTRVHHRCACVYVHQITKKSATFTCTPCTESLDLHLCITQTYKNRAQGENIEMFHDRSNQTDISTPKGSKPVFTYYLKQNEVWGFSQVLASLFTGFSPATFTNSKQTHSLSTEL